MPFVPLRLLTAVERSSSLSRTITQCLRLYSSRGERWEPRSQRRSEPPLSHATQSREPSGLFPVVISPGWETSQSQSAKILLAFPRHRLRELPRFLNSWQLVFPQCRSAAQNQSKFTSHHIAPRSPQQFHVMAFVTCLTVKLKRARTSVTSFCSRSPGSRETWFLSKVILQISFNSARPSVSYDLQKRRCGTNVVQINNISKCLFKVKHIYTHPSYFLS